MPLQTADRRIRELRPPKPRVDPWSPHGLHVEEERRPDGSLDRVLTVFLAGSECPFTCSFCDLWRWTIDGPTPPGALPAQLEKALVSAEAEATRIKLYNASNFFDSRAVPLEDWPRLALLVSPFAGVTVETHASTVGPRVLDFAGRIPGKLELAIGLETVHPLAMEHLNKRLDLAGFERACGFARANGIDIRVFVLLGAPYVSREELTESVRNTVEAAAQAGAGVVSIIPVRGGNGELERLEALGRFHPPSLRDLEGALDACYRMGSAVVAADLWDAERLPACPACRDVRIERMRRINLLRTAGVPVSCPVCAG